MSESRTLDRNVDAVVFDLDGTIYHGSSLIDGSLELVTMLRDNQIKVFYCTNNSSQTRKDVCSRLNAMGLPAQIDSVYTATHAAAAYLARQRLGTVFCFGAEGLRRELAEAGIVTADRADHAEAVVIGLDTTINYERISELLPLRGRDCRLIACNRDRFFPGDGGAERLGCGFIVSLVENLLERTVEEVVGKPSPFMLGLLMADNGLKTEKIIMVGDSVTSDICMADAAGCRAVLLTHGAVPPPGVASVATLSELSLLFESWL